MKLLIVDTDNVGLSFAWRAVQAGHQVRWYVRPEKNESTETGRGFKGVEKVPNWVAHAKWADLILPTFNDEFVEKMDQLRKQGFPIFGPTVASAKLEIDRETGMKLMEKVGIETAPYETFPSIDQALKHVQKSKERYVFKTLGDNEDKALTYVSKNPTDLENWISRIIATGKKPPGKVMLQKFISGIEMGVSRFMGKKGWVGQWNESFEHKKLMSGNFGPNCYSADSEVLTDSGWKFWPDVTFDDKICTLKDEKIKFEAPSNLVAAHFTGELIHWVNQKVNLMVTPGHTMYVTDSHSRSPMFFESADETMKHTRTILRGGVGTWCGEDDYTALPEFYKGSMQAWAALLGMHIADGYAYGARLVFGNCPNHKYEIFSKIAEEAGYELKRDQYSAFIQSRDLAKHFAAFGRSWEKYCPDYIKNGSVDTIKAFLHGYGTGDGSTTRFHNNMAYWTVSKKLADDVQELCLKVGQSASIRTGEGRDGNRVGYSVQVSKKNFKSKLTNDMVSVVSYDDMVYCCTVSSHIIYVRREGKACWCGQTGEMGTIAYFTKDSKLGEETLGKLEQDLLKLGHTGDAALGFIIDEKGKPWPTEWTCRLGWPIANMMLGATQGDPAQWMLDAVNGKDTTSFSEDIGCCLVAAHGNFPAAAETPQAASDVPVYGVTKGNKRHIHPQGIKIDVMPDWDGEKRVERPLWNTTTQYALVVTGYGKDVKQATERAYKTVSQLSISNMKIRDDVGEKLKEDLPTLHKLGYATHCNY